jgi:hypothetical protein
MRSPKREKQETFSKVENRLTHLTCRRSKCAQQKSQQVSPTGVVVG